MSEYEKKPEEDLPEVERDREDEYEIPAVTPGLEEVPYPSEDEKKMPDISPEEQQEIIDRISDEEKEEKEREKEVERIIDEVRKKKELE
ncbi:MAG: hypothetical protein AAB691_00755 [Patescibacteria group bacterium]